MLKTKSRGGQLDAVKAALRFDGFLLFPEQRVGKTWISLAIVDVRKPRKLLIVTRKNGIREWKKQIPEHLDIDWDCEIHILTHEAFARSHTAKATRKWFKSSRPQECMIILDESHRIKKRGTKVSRTLRQIAKRYAKYRIALSGTPVGEGLENGWAQMDFVDPSVFGPFDSKWRKESGPPTFVDRFCIMGGFRGLSIVGYRNQKAFRELLASRSFRRTLREVRETPLKVVNRKIYFDLPEEAQEIYQQAEDGLDLEISRRKIRKSIMMNSAGKCHQIAGGWVIEGTDSEGLKLKHPLVHDVHDFKLRRLRRLLKVHAGEKIVIAAKYRHELFAIRSLCRWMGVSSKLVYGGHPYDGEFDKQVIIIQSQAGIAIDLSESSIAIFFSMAYSFIDNAQMRSRILSYSKPFAAYYYLLARNTVDEDVYEAWRTKRKLSDVILDRWRNR